MARGVRWYLVGSLVLVTLAGCGKTFLQYGEREKWRRDAEVACMQSGTVREGAGLVRIEPIEGPGICGAAFPFKVSAFGENGALGFADEPIRPPGAIPNGTPQAQQPPWPGATSRQLLPPAQQQPVYAAPRPPQQQTYAPPRPNYSPNAPGEPLSIVPSNPPPVITATPQRYPAPPPGAALDDDDDAAPPTQPRAAPAYPSPARIAPAPPPALGPQRGPRVTGSVEVKPVATLACPIVSALDQWIANTVQPAAVKWFGAPVAEIKQISAYSCRGMNNNPGANISEHAFGNALDIAAFVLANGRRVTVKDGWHGSPEEQGFLRDVQRGACDQFTTVLAPGSNQYHYDHFHVDLMRRGTGRRICQPGAVDGDLVASRARQNPSFAARQPTPPTRAYDPPFDARNDPFAWRGDAARRTDPSTTGSINPARSVPATAAAADNDWVEDDSPRPQIDWTTDRHKPR